LTQYQLDANDLEVVLAIYRSGTLAAAGERLGIDASTVFRTLRRIERLLGDRLFDRSRAGYVALDLTLTLVESAEQVETALETAQASLQRHPADVSGTVRISTTDTLLHHLVAPQIHALGRLHPRLQFELHAGNELASLSRRDTDIAVRATHAPPPHLVGKHVGPIRVGLFTGRQRLAPSAADVASGQAAWVAPDDALPDHPSVRWRKRHHPRVVPRYRVNSILSVAEFVARGMGVGVLPLFLAEARDDLAALGDPIDECQTELWVLAHPRTRHLRRISSVFNHLARQLTLG
jgi:DNA-binding transcriptional LysR family regulator